MVRGRDIQSQRQRRLIRSQTSLRGRDRRRREGPADPSVGQLGASFPAAPAHAPRFRETGGRSSRRPHNHRLGSLLFSPAGTSRMILPRRMSAAGGRRHDGAEQVGGFLTPSGHRLNFQTRGDEKSGYIQPRAMRLLRLDAREAASYWQSAKIGGAERALSVMEITCQPDASAISATVTMNASTLASIRCR